MRAPDHPDEDLRLRSLRELALLDSRASPQWDRIAELASLICGTPIALVSLIDQDRQWFKARLGLDDQETPRDLAFCGWAILQDDLFEVEDATQDQRFDDNDLVLGPPFIRSYAGMPIKAPDGAPIGTVCAIGREPKRLTEEQKRGLRILASMAEDLANQRLVRRRLESLIEVTPSPKDAINDVAHELNTPLTPILLELAKMQRTGCAPESVERIDRNIKRLRKVVDDAVHALNQEQRHRASKE